jgi:murein tripeptide amidase MpaA
MDASRIAKVLRHLSSSAPRRTAAAEPAAPAGAATTAAASSPPPPPTLQQERYFTYEELTEMCEGVASAYPTMCELSSIGASREGRELWLLTLTDAATGAADTKPAYFIYGNIHASEPTGAHACVYNALHLLKEEQELLKRVAIYIVPRVSVDGAEYCVTTGGRVRSRKWDEPGAHREPNTIYPEDLNGNGSVVDMRVEHPSGEYVTDPLEPRLMVPRQLDSPPPYYKVFPEVCAETAFCFG